MNYTLTLSYILSYLALGLSLSNNIFLSLLVYFISAALLGLVIYNPQFTHSSNRILLLTLALLYIGLLIYYGNDIMRINDALILGIIWQLSYSILYLYVFNNLSIKLKSNLSKLIIGMNCFFISLLMIAKTYLMIKNIPFNLFESYKAIIIIISLYSLVIISQLVHSYSKCLN